MTSFQLAFQLMSRLVELDFEHVSNIVSALDLNWQYSEDMHSEVLGPYKIDERSTTRQKWTAGVDGAYIIQQTPAGRLQVDPQSSRTTLEADDWVHQRLPNYDYEYLATKGILPVFADGGVLALACGQVRRGDILLIGEHFDLVVRACSDATTFVVVGAAFTSTYFHTEMGLRACGCWEAGIDGYATRRVRICLEVTREEAFADQLVQVRVDEILVYLKI